MEDFQAIADANPSPADQVQNAETAGASGVIIFNEASPGRQALFAGSLVDASGDPIIPTIPVAFTSYEIGSTLYKQYQDAVKAGTALPAMTSIDAIVDPNADDYNVIAESKGGDKNHVVVVDAHLDAIYGAGMLDKRFWLGDDPGYRRDDEERDSAEQAAVHLVRRRATGPAGLHLLRQQSGLEQSLIRRRRSCCHRSEPTRSSFNAVGIPASGLLTGQDCCKTQAEVDLFGGQLGKNEGNLGSDDGGCVDNPFRWRDNVKNSDPNVLTFMSKAFATMVLHMAFDTKVMSASNNAVYKKTLPIAQEATRRFVAK